MSDDSIGITTRAKARQRSQSREPATNGVPEKNGAKTTRSKAAISMETVPEDVQVRPATPQNSQKSVRTESSIITIPGLNGSLTSSPHSSTCHSPIMMARVQEKEELGAMNDRLAKVLEKLGQAEQENHTLKIQLKIIKENTTIEFETQIQQYQEELDKARKALDSESLEKARFILENEKVAGEMEEMRSKYDREKRRADDADKHAKQAEKAARDNEQKMIEANLGMTDARNLYEHLKGELQDVQDQLANALASLNRETMKRTELENSLQTARDEAEFKMKMLTTKLESKTTIVTSAPDAIPRLSTHLSAMEEFRDALADARADLEENLENTYRATIDHLECERDSFKQQMEALEINASSNLGDYQEATRENKRLQKKVGDLEDEIDRLHKKYDAHKEDCNAHIQNLSEGNKETSRKYQALLKDFQEVQNSNIEISTELAMYNELVTKAEATHGIYSPGPPTKRKRGNSSFNGNGNGNAKSSHNTLERKSKTIGPIRFREVDGRVVRIENTSENMVHMGDWVVQQVKGTDRKEYRFKNDHLITGGSFISIYSRSFQELIDDDNSLVVDTDWFSGEGVKTVLMDGNGKEIADYVSSVAMNDNGSPPDRSAGSSFLKRVGGIFGRT